MEKEDTELSALVKAQADYHAAPRDLRDRIRLSLKQADEHADKAQIDSSSWRSWFQWRKQGGGHSSAGGAMGASAQQQWGMGVSFVAGMLLAIGGTFAFHLLQQRDQLTDQVVDSHVRSLMVAHLSDVVSTDQHTVKPWFDGKLDYSPPVQDLATEGYPLVGGRLDYFNGQPVAALVYRHRLHAINVLVWPVRNETPFIATSSSRQGFNVESWRENGMEFWAVSDVQSADLRAFAQLLRAKDRHG